MAYGTPNMTKHAVAFPSKVLAGNMGAHIFNITLSTAADNGNIIGRGAWNSFDNYAEAKRFCDIFYNKNSFIIEKKLNFFGWINLFHIFKKTA